MDPTAHPEELEVRALDGAARAWWWRGGDGPRPAVLLYTDAYGVRPAMQEMAGRLAALGYGVLLPDVFFRAGLRTEFFGAWMSAAPVGWFEAYLLAGGMLL